MPFHLNPVEGDKVVEIICEGPLTGFDLTMAMCQSCFLLTMCRWEKALFDLKNARFQMTAPEIASAFKELDKHIPRGAHLALIKPFEGDYDYCGLAKSIANSWTSSNAEAFEDKDAAVNWLTAHRNGASPLS